MSPEGATVVLTKESKGGNFFFVRVLRKDETVSEEQAVSGTDGGIILFLVHWTVSLCL